MTEASAIKAVFDRWRALFPSLAPGVEFTFEDVRKAEPDLTSPTASPFVHVAVTDADGELYTIGPTSPNTVGSNAVGSNKYSAFIEIDIAGPAGRGRGQVDGIADIIRQIYERQRFANDPGIGEHGVTAYVATSRRVTNPKDAGQVVRRKVLIPCDWYA